MISADTREGSTMFESFIHMLSQGAEIGAAAGHSPQTAVAALLCAALVNFLN